MGHALLISLFPLLFIFLFISGGHVNDIERIDFLSETTAIEGEYSHVKSNCDEIIRLSAKNGRTDYMLVGYYTLCWAAEHHGRIEDLRSYVEDGMEVLNKNSKFLASSDTGRMIMANMIHAAGQYYYTLGDFNRAIETFLGIVPPDKQPLTGNPEILGSVCNYLGQSYYNAGMLDKSIRYFELAYRYNQSYGDTTYPEAEYLMYKAQYEYSTGQEDEALRSLDKSISLLENDPRKLYVRRALKAIYLLYASYCKNNYDRAVYFVKKSMDLYSEKDQDFINGYRLLGDIYYSNLKHDSALLCYYRSIDFSNQIYSDVHQTKAQGYCGIANILRDDENYERALYYYRKSTNNAFLSLETMRIKAETARLYFRWYRHSGNAALLDSGIQSLEYALYLNDLCRREQFNHESKESRSVIQAEIAGLGTEMASEGYERSGDRKYIDKCFLFMEKNKGNILLDKVFELNARQYSGIPQHLLEKEIRLRGEISYLGGQLGSGRNDAFDSIKDMYNDKQLEYYNLIENFEDKYPEYYKLKYQKESATIDQLQEQLKGRNELVILFFTTDSRIYVAGVTKNRSVLKIVKKDQAFNDHFSELIDQMDMDRISEMAKDTALFNSFVRSSGFLYVQLLNPVLSEFKEDFRKLTIVPDGILCYLPFELLLTSPGESHFNYDGLPYLVRKYPVTYEYSASMLLNHTRNNGNDKISYLGFAPDYELNNSPNTKNSLVALPSVTDEIESCRHIWKGKAFYGQRATKINFAGSAGHYDIVHMAMHTLIDDEDPQSSCLIFRGSDKENEGQLYISELYNMDLNSALVILSGCETGTGRFRNGEGIISLARAFRYAGCQSLLMSLWKINDKSSRDVMVLFNGNLKRGMDKAIALQKAKTEYIRRYGNKHPAYWAAFVVIGDADPLNIQYRMHLAGLLVILTAIISYIIIRKIRNPNTHARS